MIMSIREWLLPYVLHPWSNGFIQAFQKMCGIHNGVVKNKVLYYFFKIASMTGEEFFGLIPLLFWVGFSISRCFMNNFCFTLVVGQIIKDIFRLPRPPKSGQNFTITKLEKHFETEYGLPSTHTMGGYLPYAIILYYYRHDWVNYILINYYLNFQS